ncbi:MAG: hypothetical protein R3C61_17030 [Bacteroidia bacterium]
MSIIDRLSSALGRRDEEPNIELAREIAAGENSAAVQELVAHINDKDKAIQSNCIKVLYEIGEIKPALIAPFAGEFVTLLGSKNNRLQWGAMTALDAITSHNPRPIYEALPRIIAVADSGSVITNDHCVGILVQLCGVAEYEAEAFPLLIERIVKSPVNQLSMYAEKAQPVIKAQHKARFIATLSARLPDIDKPSKRTRVEKVMKKIEQRFPPGYML